VVSPRVSIINLSGAVRWRHPSLTVSYVDGEMPGPGEMSQAGFGQSTLPYQVIFASGRCLSLIVRAETFATDTPAARPLLASSHAHPPAMRRRSPSPFASDRSSSYYRLGCCDPTRRDHPTLAVRLPSSFPCPRDSPPSRAPCRTAISVLPISSIDSSHRLHRFRHTGNFALQADHSHLRGKS
jgi:hypothetical protein